MNLLEQYLIDVNTLDENPEKKIKRMKSNMLKGIDEVCIKIIAICIGIMTLKVLIEQLVMQLGVYLK